MFRVLGVYNFEVGSKNPDRGIIFFISLELDINLSNCSFVNKYLKVQIKRQGLKWKKLFSSS